MTGENLEKKRWIIAVAAIFMQLCLGCVYAWSVFKKALIASHGWTETQTQFTFVLCIGLIGLFCAFGGTILDKKGPRFTGTLGGILYGLGTLLAGYADQIGSLWLLYLGYGVIAAIGNGFGYITPIATLVRWFPDKRGLVTGLAVMGFGMGAFFMGKIAPVNINNMGVANTFYLWGAIFLVVVTLAAQFYKNPPAGWLPAGFTPVAGGASSDADSYETGEAIRTPQWWMLWAMLCLNISAGIGLISQLSPMAQNVIKLNTPDISPQALAVAGGTILAIASIFNGVGRLFWAWTSDFLGRRGVFLTMFLTQAILYVIFPKITSQLLFTVVACYLLACYGGGFATMPAFAADAFGPKNIGRIYGIMLTAWGAAGVIGPLLFARIYEVTQSFQGALYSAAALLAVGFIIALIYKKPERRKA